MLKRRTQKKIIVVTRQTRADDLKKRFSTAAQASFFVKSRGGNYEDYQHEDKAYKAAVSEAETVLNTWGRVQVIDRKYLPNFIFAPDDTVIAIGQDGLVANTLKYLLEGQALIGINPEPERWDGVLLPFQITDLTEIIPLVLEGRHSEKNVTMARARFNDGQTILAVNDFFVGQRTHTSARYILEIAGQKERHSSSGIIVSTGLGSTGWLKSLLGGAVSIAQEISGTSITPSPESVKLPWDTQSLYFTVREPFPSVSTQSDLVFGSITSNQPLTIRSLMSEGGVLFSDGIESDFIGFNSGSQVTIDLAEEQGHLVVA